MKPQFRYKRGLWFVHRSPDHVLAYGVGVTVLGAWRDYTRYRVNQELRKAEGLAP